MKFKRGTIEEEFYELETAKGLRWKAMMLAYAIDGWMQGTYGIQLKITSIYREEGNHKWCWMFDMADNMTPEQGDVFKSVFNDMFKYSDEKLTIVDERGKPEGSTNWTGPHFHVQVNWRNGEQWI